MQIDGAHQKATGRSQISLGSEQEVHRVTHAVNSPITPGMSAVQFQRQQGLRYETAFQILHKLRAGRVRPERDSIGAQYPVEVDETLVGGRTKGEGRGIHQKR